MFRDAVIEPAAGFSTTWPTAEPLAPLARIVARFDAFAEDEVGAVAHVYREIARRISNNAFTTHASTLGDALR